MSRPPEIPFTGWAPTPRRIMHDVAAGRLTPSEGRVEAALYMLVNPETWTVRVRDLDELGRRIGWELKSDTLYRVLAELRRKGRIAFATKPGKTRHAYEIRVLYDARLLSEHGPSRKSAVGPSRNVRGSGSTTGDGDSAGAPRSEQEAATVPEVGPSRGGAGPSSEAAEIAMVKRDFGAVNRTAVRALRDLREKNKPLNDREVVGPASLSRERARETGDIDENMHLISDGLDELAEARARGAYWEPKQ